jgi:CBS domain-containing protein
VEDGAMGMSEFDDAYDDDTGAREREEQRLGEAILAAPIQALEPRHAVTVPESASIREAISLMLDRQIGAVLVVKDGRAVGIFTERDVLRRVATSGIDQGHTVAEVMTRDPESLGLNDGIAFALNRMIVGGYRHVPIVDDAGAPLAVLSLREVVAFIVSLLPSRVLNLPPEPRHEVRSADGG